MTTPWVEPPYPAQDTTHVAQAQAQLLVQYQQSPNMLGLIAVIAGRIQLVENALFSVMAYRSLATAYGQQLDNLGKVIGLLRSAVLGGSATASAWSASTVYALNATVSNGGNIYICTAGGTSASSGGPTGTGTGIVDGGVTWNYVSATGDSVYSRWLRIQILVNNSSGTAPNLIAIVQADGDVGTVPTVNDSGAMSCIVNVGAVPTSNPTALSAALQAARAAGVHLVTYYLYTTPALTFTYDGTTAQAFDNGLYAGAL